VIRKFEIIGEAAKMVPVEVQQKYPEGPRGGHGKKGDKPHHFYFGVQHELVWQTIADSLPALKSHIEKAISELKS